MAKPITMVTLRYFRRLIDLELSGRQSDHKYCDILRDVFACLGLPQNDVSPINLAASEPPVWVKQFPELEFAWERAHLRFLEAARVRRSA